MALNISPHELTEPVDSVGVCLSKGLSAPIGSVLTGDREFIDHARKWRKMLGGGMRQVGIIAAAGQVALEKMIARLVKDHQNAQRLASGLKRIPGIILSQEKVPTNIVFFGLDGSVSEKDFNKKLTGLGVKVSYLGEQKYRAVTHRLITKTDIDEALKHIESAVKNMV
jgi:threonine aldolase